MEGTPTHMSAPDDLSDLLWDASEHAFLTGILSGGPAGLPAINHPFPAWSPPANAAPPPAAGPTAQGDFQAMASLRRAESRDASSFWSLLDAPLDVAAHDV